MKISKVPSVFRNQAVHHRNGISMHNQSASQVGPNEAQAPGNENLLIGYIFAQLVGLSPIFLAGLPTTIR